MPCKPSSYASPQKVDRAVKVKFHDRQGSDKPYEAAALAFGNDIQLSGAKAGPIFDSNGPCGGGGLDAATVMPGKTYTHEQAYAAGKAKGDLQIALQPDFASDKAVFPRQQPGQPAGIANVSATLMSSGIWCPPNPIVSVTDRHGRDVPVRQQPCERGVSERRGRHRAGWAEPGHRVRNVGARCARDRVASARHRQDRHDAAERVGHVRRRRQRLRGLVDGFRGRGAASNVLSRAAGSPWQLR